MVVFVVAITTTTTTTKFLIWSEGKCVLVVNAGTVNKIKKINKILFFMFLNFFLGNYGILCELRCNVMHIHPVLFRNESVI